MNALQHSGDANVGAVRADVWRWRGGQGGEVELAGGLGGFINSPLLPDFVELPDSANES
jgi:hypothetical protein